MQKLTWKPFLSTNNALTKNWCLTLTLSSSFVGYFFDPDALGGPQIVPGEIVGRTDPIGDFSFVNIFRGSKTRIFSNTGVGG